MHDSLPIMYSGDFSQATHDQLNSQWDYFILSPRMKRIASYLVEESGDALNYVTRVMCLIQGKLLKQHDWHDWQDLEFLQLDHYFAQGMFGNLRAATSDKAIFNLVWTYNIKALDGRKKACCTCDGSPRLRMVRILDETYANCVEQTSSRLFYAISAAKNLLIFGADVSNAFVEAPSPQQGFFVWPDCAFHEWWTIHLKRPPIPDGHVLPVLSAMQGHPESLCLWGKHTNTILHEIGLIPTIHKPCLYSGIVDGKRVIFKRQVDDFAIAAPDKCMADPP